MVPADSAAFLRLSDGKVLGVAQPAKKGRAFTVVTAPAATSAKAAQAGTTKRNEPSTRVTKKGDVTTTTVVVTKPDGTVQTTVTSVNAKTKTTTSTTTTKAPVKKPVKKPVTTAGSPLAPLDHQPTHPRTGREVTSDADPRQPPRSPAPHCVP